MIAVLTGFAAVLTLIAVGYVAARVRIVEPGTDEVLTRVLFYIAMPALLFITMVDADPRELFSPLLLGVIISVGVTALLFVVVAPKALALNEKVIGALTSSYVNAGNLGIPIAAYVLGDATLVAPVLFVQLLIMAPLALSTLDVLNSGKSTGHRMWLTPFTNPIVIGALSGLLVGLAPISLPTVVRDPISLMAGAAVPMALFLYGVSLNGSLRGGGFKPSRELWTSVVLKNIAHPALAYLAGTYVLGLSAHHVFALTVLSALPTAQNVFVYALRYRSGVQLAQGSVLVTTGVSIPVLIVIAALLA